MNEYFFERTLLPSINTYIEMYVYKYESLYSYNCQMQNCKIAKLHYNNKNNAITLCTLLIQLYI